MSTLQEMLSTALQAIDTSVAQVGSCCAKSHVSRHVYRPVAQWYRLKFEYSSYFFFRFLSTYLSLSLSLTTIFQPRVFWPKLKIYRAREMAKTWAEPKLAVKFETYKPFSLALFVIERNIVYDVITSFKVG